MVWQNRRWYSSARYTGPVAVSFGLKRLRYHWFLLRMLAGKRLNPPPSISISLEGKTHFSRKKISRAFNRQFTTIPVQQKEPSKGSMGRSMPCESQISVVRQEAPPPHRGQISEPRLLCALLMPPSSSRSCPPEKTNQPLCFWSRPSGDLEKVYHSNSEG